MRRELGARDKQVCARLARPAASRRRSTRALADMIKPRGIALIKLGCCVVVSLALLFVWHSASDSPFRGVALGALIVVAAPTTLLVAIDTGRALRKDDYLGGATKVVSWLPQLFLGSLACFAGSAGLAFAIGGSLGNWWWRAYGIVMSFFLFYYGQSQLRQLLKRGTSE